MPTAIASTTRIVRVLSCSKSRMALCHDVVTASTPGRLREGTSRNDRAVGELDGAVDDAPDIGIVSGDDHGRAAGGHAPEKIENSARIRGVEVAGRFVGQN